MDARLPIEDPKDHFWLSGPSPWRGMPTQKGSQQGQLDAENEIPHPQLDRHNQ